MTTRPNFFIVGAPKCGTTAWVNYLSTHPDIGFPNEKEPHYFNTDLAGFRWARSEQEYLSKFDLCAGKPRIGEGSVLYLYSKEAAANIAEFDASAKILIFVREPVGFLRSYHNQLLLNLDEDIVDINQAWRLSGRRDKENIPSTCREPKLLDYIAVARVGEQIDRYFQHFPDKQIKIVQFDHWCKEPRATYLEILSFLGLPDDGRLDFPRVHEAKHHSSRKLARMIQRPPSWALSTSAAVRRVFGLRRLGIAQLIRRLNRSKGYRASGPDTITETTSESIHSALAEDQRKLRNRIQEQAA